MLSITPFLSLSYVSRMRLATFFAPSRSVSPELMRTALDVLRVFLDVEVKVVCW